MYHTFGSKSVIWTKNDFVIKSSIIYQIQFDPNIFFFISVTESFDLVDLFLPPFPLLSQHYGRNSQFCRSELLQRLVELRWHCHFLENLEFASSSLGSSTSVQTFIEQWSICQECLICGIFHLGGVTRIFGLRSTQNVQVLRFCWNALSGNIFLLDLTQLTQFDSFYFSLTRFDSFWLTLNQFESI